MPPWRHEPTATPPEGNEGNETPAPAAEKGGAADQAETDERGGRRRRADPDVGRQDAARDAGQRRWQRVSGRAHGSTGRGDALDVLQLAAVDDTALHRILE